LTASGALFPNCASISSAAVRTVVWRIVFAWKNDQRLDASM
jgi:hypothetical protein